MSPTLDQLVYNVLNMASGGRSTNNEHVSIRQIKDWVHQYRATYIRRDEERNRRLREFEQTISSLATEQVQISPVIRKTTKAIPQLLRLKDNEALTHVGDLLGLETYQVVDEHSVKWRRFNDYTSADPIAFVHPDGHVYIQNADNITTITVRGIFENPEIVQNFLITQGEAGEDDEWRYPLPIDMSESIVKNILKTEMNITKSSPLDTKADTLPDEKTGQPQSQ